jgi:hypothetical protein
VSHLAVYLPGGYLPSEDPFVERLAWITLRALEQTATHVEAVQYDRVPLRGGDEFREFQTGVLRDVGAALDTYVPERVTFVGKSLGTHALALVCESLGTRRHADDLDHAGVETR